MSDIPATLDDSDMSQETISRLILDQLKSLREDMREALKDVNDDIKGIKEDIGEIKDEIADRGGIRDRLTKLEIKTQEAIDLTSAYPPPPESVKKKKPLKEHAPALGAGMGVTGLLYGLVELANAYLKTKW